tara:strand:+ start:2271 stop:3950 length:1680 start_codon:yes stop_codon:yes gene_type:complete
MNQNSKVLSLKYRPKNFNDLIGQDILAHTILNSIKLNKVPNAYLFTGIRGIGKTTIARIVAKSLNCKKGFENLCKEELCENCEGITNSNHIDVFELDAASRSSVENTKELIEFSRYAPTSSKYKIYILDECHMLSKQAWNSLLKTLEEPPEYLKFIFATTEIKKVPITIISRCQRFDLSRVKTLELFDFIKKIKNKEKGNVSDDALKLIVKISEGSVRDALSLLDRAILSADNNSELDLKKAQEIFGHFDRSQLINLFKLIFSGDEEGVLRSYRTIYDQGVEPKVFINDFLEVLYYFKNIKSLKVDGTNFSLNDEEFSTIKEISKNIDPDTFLLFWQFTIKTLGELDIVINQNFSIEMFLIRLVYLKGISNFNDIDLKSENYQTKDIVSNGKKISDNKDNEGSNIKNKTIGQIKNVIQEKQVIQKSSDNKKNFEEIEINSFNDLLEICIKKKEAKLRYELEHNVNLVNFENKRIEISINENLDKEFIKNLTSKLYEWTLNRWLITISKSEGLPSIKQKKNNIKKQLLETAKKDPVYQNVMEIFSDAELIDIQDGSEDNG